MASSHLLQTCPSIFNPSSVPSQEQGTSFLPLTRQEVEAILQANDALSKRNGSLFRGGDTDPSSFQITQQTQVRTPYLATSATVWTVSWLVEPKWMP